MVKRGSDPDLSADRASPLLCATPPRQRAACLSPLDTTRQETRGLWEETVGRYDHVPEVRGQSPPLSKDPQPPRPGL